MRRYCLSYHKFKTAFIKRKILNGGLKLGNRKCERIPDMWEPQTFADSLQAEHWWVSWYLWTTNYTVGWYETGILKIAKISNVWGIFKFTPILFLISSFQECFPEPCNEFGVRHENRWHRESPFWFRNVTWRKVNRIILIYDRLMVWLMMSNK